MRSQVRFSLLALLVGAMLVVSAPAAQAAFGITEFFAGNCKKATCTKVTPVNELFTQAAGHPNFGITDFTLNGLGTVEGNGVKTIRTDVPVGISTNPQALPQCSLVDFNANLKKAEANHCNTNTEVGTQKVTIFTGGLPVELTGTVYNLDPTTAAPPLHIPLYFGIDINTGVEHVHSFLEGFVSWHHEAEAEQEGIASGDYHEFFKISVPNSFAEGSPPIAGSRLSFKGNVGKGLLTNPSACPGPQT
ncbi:MAG TPA: hypothetical protein VII01_16405, partial [Solirubrobacteraceae bacterium]